MFANKQLALSVTIQNFQALGESGGFLNISLETSVTPSNTCFSLEREREREREPPHVDQCTDDLN